MRQRIPNSYRVEFFQVAVRNDDGSFEKLAAPWFIAAYRVDANTEEDALSKALEYHGSYVDDELVETRVVEVDY